MIPKRIHLIVFAGCLCACTGSDQNNIRTGEEVKESIKKATENTIPFEGRFVKLEQINQRDYYLYLKGKGDSITTFLTMMPLSETDISLLKKQGNNIKIAYKELYNPVKKKTDKLVQWMHPVYDLPSK